MLAGKALATQLRAGIRRFFQSPVVAVVVLGEKYSLWATNGVEYLYATSGVIPPELKADNDR